MGREAEHAIASKLKEFNHTKEIGNISKLVVTLVYLAKCFIHSDVLLEQLVTRLK